jgi:hypothetical protein
MLLILRYRDLEYLYASLISHRFNRKEVASYLFNDVSALMIWTFLGPFIYSETSEIEIG